MNRPVQVRILPSELDFNGPVGNRKTTRTQNAGCCGFNSHLGHSRCPGGPAEWSSRSQREDRGFKSHPGYFGLVAQRLSLRLLSGSTWVRIPPRPMECLPRLAARAPALRRLAGRFDSCTGYYTGCPADSGPESTKLGGQVRLLHGLLDLQGCAPGRAVGFQNRRRGFDSFRSCLPCDAAGVAT